MSSRFIVFLWDVSAMLARRCEEEAKRTFAEMPPEASTLEALRTVLLGKARAVFEGAATRRPGRKRVLGVGTPGSTHSWHLFGPTARKPTLL